ncbi:GDSL-type esterase/lipase family protein [Pelosinus sp. sgz500959]|uniref:GDSL-type esterase/lipase family protein n=1 Tax=Pelosinus sp. sgz500959 TaxID=3242472 RepID=UPI003670192F
MKKLVIPIILFTLIFSIQPWRHAMIATAEKAEENLYQRANDLSRKPEDPPYLSLYYRFKKMCFSIDPHHAHPVVFLGDSITDEGNWSKLFPNSLVENRGIGGDTTLGVLNRLDQVILSKPSQIFLMIGTNDLCFNRSIPDIITNYRHILTRFQTELPNTKVYIQSVLPFNDTMFPSQNLRTNNNITQLNIEIKRLAHEYHYKYIDLTPAFTGVDGRLPTQDTIDGLHLNDTGYLIWHEQIKGLVNVSH